MMSLACGKLGYCHRVTRLARSLLPPANNAIAPREQESVSLQLQYGCKNKYINHRGAEDAEKDTEGVDEGMREFAAFELMVNKIDCSGCKVRDKVSNTTDRARPVPTLGMKLIGSRYEDSLPSDHYQIYYSTKVLF